MTPQEFGKLLSDLRAGRGLTVQQAVNRTRIRPSVMIDIENGKYLPPEDVIVRIADCYEVNRDALMKHAGMVSSDVINIIIENADIICAALRELKGLSTNEVNSVMWFSTSFAHNLRKTKDLSAKEMDSMARGLLISIAGKRFARS